MVSKHAWDTITWWEVRRLPYNAVLAVCGFASILAVVAIGSSHAPPGEDAIEPALLFVAVILYALGANAAYTLGWITELVWAGPLQEERLSARRKAFALGLLGSISLTLLPMIGAGVAWAAFGFR